MLAIHIVSVAVPQFRTSISTSILPPPWNSNRVMMSSPTPNVGPSKVHAYDVIGTSRTIIYS